MRGVGLIFITALMRHLSGLLRLSGPRLALLGLIATPNSPIGRYNPPLAVHPPHPSPAQPLKHVIHDITVVVKKVVQNPAVLASYKR